MRSRDWLTLLMAVALAIACGAVACGCGSVDVAQVDAAQAVDAAPDREPSRDTDPPDAGAALDVQPEVTGPSCSWDCRAFCDCGALPCCRSTTSADCCTQ